MSLQGWQVCVFLGGLRPSNVSAALLRLASFFENASQVTCPLLFFALPSSLKMPAKYYSLLDLVFFSSAGCECDRASIYMSSQGCQFYVFQDGLRSNTILFLTLSPFCDGCVCDRASLCLLVLARVVGSCHLGRPSAQYSSLLDLVFSSSAGYDRDKASICMSLQEWQVSVFQGGLRPSNVSTALLQLTSFSGKAFSQVLFPCWPCLLFF